MNTQVSSNKETRKKTKVKKQTVLKLKTERAAPIVEELKPLKIITSISKMSKRKKILPLQPEYEKSSVQVLFRKTHRYTHKKIKRKDLKNGVSMAQFSSGSKVNVSHINSEKKANNNLPGHIACPLTPPPQVCVDF